LSSSNTGAISRAISTERGIISIGNPYTINGSDPKYLTDYKLLYPRAIYGIR
jgi:hypothetical protein